MKNFLLSDTVQARYNRGMTLAVAFIVAGFVLGAIPERFNGLSLLAILSGLVGLAVGLNATKVAEAA